MTIHPSRRRVAVACGIATLVALPAIGAASAAPPEREHWHDAGSVVEDACGLTLRRDHDFSGSFLIVRRGKEGLQYFSNAFNGSVVWTNLATGKSFELRRAGVEKDATVVDNGDGTLSIVVLATGTSRFYDANGRMVFSDNGRLRFELRIDHNGTPDDYTDDGEAEFVGIVTESNGTNGTAGRDFCEDLHIFTG